MGMSLSVRVECGESAASKGLCGLRLEFLGLGLAVEVDAKKGLARVGLGVSTWRCEDEGLRGRLM
jgi:hypothetical protein